MFICSINGECLWQRRWELLFDVSHTLRMIVDAENIRFQAREKSIHPANSISHHSYKRSPGCKPMPGQSTIIGKIIFGFPGFPKFFTIVLIGISDTFLAYRPCYRLFDFNTF